MSDAVRPTPRELVEKVFGPEMTRDIWTGNYAKVLPVSVQGFDVGAVLPSVFYMFRFGQRRGAGSFLDAFGPDEGTKAQRRRETTAHSVALKLASNAHGDFVGVDGDAEMAILADLLLCYCLENRRYELGHTKPIQRVVPTHYMASWVDLPETIVNLRWVPETMVAILANQKKVQHVGETKTDERPTWFPVVMGSKGNIFVENLLLMAASQGMQPSSNVGNLVGDRFAEDADVGIDQLLMIRIAQMLGKAPDPVKGTDKRKIPNQRPIAKKTYREFSEDIRKFVRGYAPVVPRQAFVEMMESCMAVGLTSILASVVEVILEWTETGEVAINRGPTAVFVDSSAGTDRQLRRVAEQSMDDYVRRMERFPASLMALRLLDFRARKYKPVLMRLKAGELRSAPEATEWIEFLGNVLHDRCPEAGRILRSLEDRAEDLAEVADSNGYPAVADTLRNDQAQPNPVWRLAEALAYLHRQVLRKDLHVLLDSVLHAERPNGLAAKRRTRRKTPDGRAQPRQLRSVVFTDPVLEYLVHRLVLPSGAGKTRRRLSLVEFIDELHDRYGFCVDEASPGMTISNDLLQRNRRCLERRLRDLGLLVGVNDAEQMKRLRPRFRSVAP